MLIGLSLWTILLVTTSQSKLLAETQSCQEPRDTAFNDLLSEFKRFASDCREYHAMEENRTPAGILVLRTEMAESLSDLRTEIQELKESRTVLQTEVRELRESAVKAHLLLGVYFEKISDLVDALHEIFIVDVSNPHSVASNSPPSSH